ncbi:MAG: methyltransferase domain-containing protein [Dehalococcoidia bacterium]
MPDVWSSVTQLDDAMQDRLAAVLETRGADPQQQALRQTFLAAIPFPPQAQVLEVGCGTGVLTRLLARWPEVGAVVGVDPAPALLTRAHTLAAGLPNVTFRDADGRALPFEEASFDVVIFDSVLSHVPGPDRALAEAVRVLRPGGVLALFDGDYATTTVALGDHDPLQACVDAMMANSVTDRYVVRRLPALVRLAGLEVIRVGSHGFVETEGGYMVTVIERGIDFLRSAGHLDDDTAAALNAAARRRVDAGTFFGHIAYASLMARKP